jgi:hypothetical protein
VQAMMGASLPNSPRTCVATPTNFARLKNSVTVFEQ